MTIKQKAEKLVPFVTNAASQSGKIHYCTITSKSGNPGESIRTIDITGAIAEIFFYESILSNTLTATIIILDTGFVADGEKAAKTSGLMSTLKLSGGERVDFKIEDNNFNNARVKKSIIEIPGGMYINRVRDMSNTTLKNVFAIDLVSSEFINNEKIRVTKRYDGKISESVSKILGDLIKGGSFANNPDIEESSTEYSFIGNSKKPLYVCSWLASKCVPSVPTTGGKSPVGIYAGYFFYQTRDRFNFVSIDKKMSSLQNSNSVKKFVYNNTGRLNEGEDESLNILSYSVKRTVDLGKDLSLGTYGNTTLFFDFLSMNYLPRTYDVVQDQSNGLNVNLNLPAREITEGPSRLMTRVLDVGTLPKGNTSQKQLEEWKKDPTKPTFDAANTMVQSIMRYNQLFSVQTNVIVAGDFTISPGDIIECNFASLNPDYGKEWDPEISTKYMVASVCHRMTPTETYTSLDLVSDTKGNYGGKGK